MRMDLPNLLGLARPVREMLNVTLTELGYDEEFREELGLAATELLNNSFEHASEREEHVVTLGWSAGGENCEFWVHDEGEGRITQEDFDLMGEGPPDHFEDRGRGLFLIRAFCDRVEVRDAEEGGTIVRIVKSRRPE